MMPFKVALRLVLADHPHARYRFAVAILITGQVDHF
jgi:hypothetical protein